MKDLNYGIAITDKMVEYIKKYKKGGIKNGES